jgi:predicted transcriptional regulator
MTELTKAEEQVMQVLWKLKSGFVNDILLHFPEPKPAYNTVSTIVRILQRKGIVGYSAFGKAHEYFPLINKKEYTRGLVKNVVKNYFGNSYKAIASYFAQDDNLTIKEMEELRQLIDEQIKNQKELRDE